MVGITVLADVGRLASLAAEPGTRPDRAAAFLERLRDVVPYECAEVSAWDAAAGQHRVLANTGYDDAIIELFHGPRWREEMAAVPEHRSGLPVRQRDVPPGALGLRSCLGVLRPHGFAEGVTMRLLARDGRYTGMLNLSTRSAEGPSDEAVAVLGALNAALAQVADELRPLRVLAGLVAPGAAGVALGVDGRPRSLPGVPTAPVLLDPPLPAIACALPTRAPSAFLWPAGAGTWHRVRLIPSGEDPSFRGILTATAPEPLALTRREVEVLTLLARGESNPSIGAHLHVSARTAATHVERILVKLGVQSRAAAAAHAVARGLILPTVRDSLPAISE